MILILIALILLILSIIFAVKTDKVICKILPVVIVLVTVFYLYSIHSFPIPSLVKNEFPENYKIEISEEIKEKLSEEKSGKNYNGNENEFNGMKYKIVTTDKRWSQQKNRIVSFDDDDYDYDSESSYFDIQYFDFYNSENAGKAFEDIIFSTNVDSFDTLFHYNMPYIMRCLSDDRIFEDTRDVSGVLIKKVRGNPQMITTFSTMERWNFMSNPLLGGLPGERFHSACAYIDGQYIVVIHEINRSRGSNMYEMLECLKNESKGS